MKIICRDIHLWLDTLCKVFSVRQYLFSIIFIAIIKNYKDNRSDLLKYILFIVQIEIIYLTLI